MRNTRDKLEKRKTRFHNPDERKKDVIGDKNRSKAPNRQSSMTNLPTHTYVLINKNVQHIKSNRKTMRKPRRSKSQWFSRETTIPAWRGFGLHTFYFTSQLLNWRKYIVGLKWGQQLGCRCNTHCTQQGHGYSVHSNYLFGHRPAVHRSRGYYQWPSF